MIQYQVIGNYKHTKNVRISTEKTLQDAYETIYFVGHGTQRKYTIVQVESEEIEKITAKTAQERIKSKAKGDN